MIPGPQFRCFVKHAAVSLEKVERPRVGGLKQPRLATPRLLAKKPPGKTPVNPFRVNWKKLGSATGALVGLGVLGTGAAAAGLTAKRLATKEPLKKKPLLVRAGQSAAQGSLKPLLESPSSPQR